MNRVADLTIYVIRAGLFDRRQLADLERMYRQEKFRNMSVILKGVNYSHTGYGYGYEYGNDDGRKIKNDMNKKNLIALLANKTGLKQYEVKK